MTSQDVQFPFPFEPYPIQKDFMRNLYECFESSSLGIFESPTGTGKSLSLICGSLKWLKDFEKRRRLDLRGKITELERTHAVMKAKKDGDWLKNAYEASQAQEELMKVKKSLQAAEELEKRVQELKSFSKLKVKKDFAALIAGLKKQSVSVDFQTQEDDLETDDDLKAPVSDEEEEEEEVYYKETQVIFATRTHSQLAQFVGELRKSPFGEEVRAVTLASRANLCVNPDVLKLGNPSFINERCLEMKEKGSKTTKKAEDGTVAKKQRKTKSTCGPCPYLRQEAVQELADRSLAKLTDMEDLKAMGLESKACPYYAARKAVKMAQVVAVPYNILLHSKTRDTCGIDLEGSVVVIDEAHNLADMVASIYGARVTGAQLCHAFSQLKQYHDKYETRFAPANKVKITQVLFILKKLMEMLGAPESKYNPDLKTGVTEEQARILHCPDFVFDAKLDTQNFFEILEFCRALRLPQKLYGFKAFCEPQNPLKPFPANEKLKQFLKGYKNPVKEEKLEEPKVEEKKEVRSSPLLVILEFIEALTCKDEGGKVIIKKAPSLSDGSLQYLLLDPGEHMKPIVSAAKAVVVAGGTMQPTDEFKNILFASQPSSRFKEFSCGHVVPKENILCLGMAKGSSGKLLDFSFNERSRSIDELGATLAAFVNVVPGGFVVFFPSYGFEAEVVKKFKENGVLERLNKRKPLFREPKTSSEVDKVLSDYASAVKEKGGALLFAVVGGKVSEGINFGDDLGRCVALVGLPYPNAKSPELMEKMRYLDAKHGNGAGRRHYENLCLKALNQSIGRAIRHQNDYATILLLDSRYCSKAGIKAGLPGWIRSSFHVHSDFRSAFGGLRGFFAGKKLKVI